MLAASLLASPALCKSQVSRTAPLPFDTVGARRGVPANTFEFLPQVQWLGGDTRLWGRLTYFAQATPAVIELSADGSDTAASRFNERLLKFAECPFELALYTTPRRTGVPAWQSRRAPRSAACPTLIPRRAGELVARYRLDSILGDSLGARPYYFEYAIRLADGRRVTYRTGEAFLSREPIPSTRDRSTLRFTSTSELGGAFPRTLTVRSVIKNTGPKAVIIAHGACSVHTRLWRSANRESPPVWKSELRQPLRRRGDTSRQRVVYGCPLPLYVATIMPNDTLALGESIPVPEILADSLPDGHYWVSVDMELLNDSLRPPAWATHYTLPAGAVTLSRLPDRPPSVRQEGSIRYAAATRLVRSRSQTTDSVVTFVLVTNTSADSVTLDFVRGNPVMVYGFGSAEERDEYPMPTPLYAMPGNDRFYAPARVSLGPNEKFLFEHAVAANDVIARVGPRHLHFLAWFMGEPPMLFLSAGEIDFAR